MFSSRALRWAVIVSLLVHLVVLLAGRDGLSRWLETPEDDLLAVRLVPPPAAPPPKAVHPKPPAAAEASFPLPIAPPTELATPSLVPAAPSAAVPGPAAPVVQAAPAPILQSARTLPGSGHLRFAVSRGQGAFVVGRAVHDWKIDGDRYELKSVIQTTGLVALFADVQLQQSSRGHLDASGLHPDTFLDNRKDGQYRADFDWSQGALRLSNGSALPLQAGAQDLLSMFYQLALYPLDGSEVALMVTTGRKFERYVFTVEADVPLQVDPRTDAAPIPTYHLAYHGRDAEGVEVWLARDLQRLPVKIRYTDRNGGIIEMFAEDIQYQGKK